MTKIPKYDPTRWKDATSYSRDEATGHKIPRTYEYKTESLKIIVTRLGILPGWYLLCYDIGINNHRQLQVGEDLDAAMREAINRVRGMLRLLLSEIPEA